MEDNLNLMLVDIFKRSLSEQGQVPEDRRVGNVTLLLAPLDLVQMGAYGFGLVQESPALASWIRIRIIKSSEYFASCEKDVGGVN